MRTWILLLLVAAACGKKEAGKGSAATAASGTAGSGTAASGTASGTAAGSGTASGTAAGGGTASGGTGTATLAAGEPTLGCFAWSASAGAAACLTGSRGTAGDEVSLIYVGDTRLSVDVGGEITAAVAADAGKALAEGGYQPLTGSATALTAGKPAVIEGATVSWTSAETHPGGNNQAPTRRDEVEVSCADGERVTVFEEEAEGNTASVSVRAMGGAILIEFKIDIALEGEYGHSMGAAVVKAATCELAMVQ